MCVVMELLSRGSTDGLKADRLEYESARRTRQTLRALRIE